MKSPHFLMIAILFAILLASVIVQYYYTQPFTMEKDNEAPIEYFVITMGNPERLENIKKQQEKMRSPLQIFNAAVLEKTPEALDAITDPILSNDWKTNAPSGMNRRYNETGCYLSHYNIYKKIKADNRPGFTVIFEDDFIITHDNFEQTFHNALNNAMANRDFDILYVNNLTENIGEKIAENICKIDMSRAFWGTQAYLVNNQKIDKLLDLTSIMDEPIDTKIERGMHEGKITVYTFCPQLTREDKNIGTTIHLA
jgi:hypothetical protein